MEFVSWRQIWAVAIGDEPPVKHLPPAVSSIITYSLVNLFCFLMYTISSAVLPSFIRIYAQDFFKTLVFCSYSFGHGIMRDYHGNFGYYLAVVPLNTITVLMFTSGEGNPLGNWSSYLRGALPLWKFLTRVTVQMFAGFSAFQLGRLIYKLDYHWSFAQQLQQTECSTALTVPVYLGFAIETFGTMYDAWVNYQPLYKVKAVDIFLKFMNMAAVVCLGVYLTGMFMHPSMASGLTFGCKGTSEIEHIFVYWIGPFLGIYLAIKLDKVFNLKGSSAVEKKPTSGKEIKEYHGTKNHKEAEDKSNNNIRQRKRRKYYK